MRSRSPLLLSLLLLSLSLFPTAGSAQPVEVGQVVRVVPDVTGGIPGRKDSYRLLVEKAKVAVGTEVVTGKRAGTRIRVGTGGGPIGTVDVGPRSRFIFEEWVAEAVEGKASLSVQFGYLLAYFQPRTTDENQLITITTSVGILYVTGTALYLEVEPDSGSTSVGVLEGAVRVVSNSGGEVIVTAGNQTRVVMGQPPTPPTPFHASPGGPDRGLTKDLIVDPPLVDLDDPRLDLPK